MRPTSFARAVAAATVLWAPLADAQSPDVIGQPGTVLRQAKISSTEGGFTGLLHDEDLFAIGLARIGDLDGDGVTELAAGALLDDDGGLDRGAVWILFLRADGTVKAQTKISSVEGGFAGPLDDNDIFGWSVAGMGDLDGDGVPDLAAGAWLDDDGGSSEITDHGAVWLLRLNPDGTVKAQSKISGSQGGFTAPLDDGDRFGSSLAPLGDLDGDGVGDLAAGTVYDDDGGINCGCVYVLLLAADGSVKAHQKISNLEGGLTGIDVNSRFGYSSVAIGDVDADGIVDLAVGAILDNDGGPQRGAVWVLFLARDGTVRDHVKISSVSGGFTGELDDFDTFGRACAAPGDLDGDGVPDLLVGAGGDDDGESNAGAVWVLFLDRDGSVKAHAKISALAGQFDATLDDGDDFGQSLAALGDLDGDGVADVAAGALLDDDGGHERGAIHQLFLSDGRWTNLLSGLAGAAGTPRLTGQGSLSAGAPFSLRVEDGAPLAPAVLVAGAGWLGAPLKGGTLVPVPLSLVAASLDAAGGLLLQGPWPPGVPPGLSLLVQAWIVDAGGPAGYAATNGLAATPP